MKKKVVVLGGGMIGSAMAMDLSRRGEWDVTVADLRAETLARIAKAYGVRTIEANLSDPEAVTRASASVTSGICSTPTTPRPGCAACPAPPPSRPPSWPAWSPPEFSGSPV